MKGVEKMENIVKDKQIWKILKKENRYAGLVIIIIYCIQLLEIDLMVDLWPKRRKKISSPCTRQLGMYSTREF